MKRQRGSVLTITIMSTAISTLVAAGLFAMTIRNAAVVERLHRSMEAFFLAETGINEMLALLKEDWFNKDRPEEYPSGTLGRGSYSVNILQPEGRVIIEAMGNVKGIKRKMYVEVIWEGGEAFNYGLFSNGAIALSGGSQIDTDVRSNGSISVSGGADLLGDAAAHTTITVSGSGSSITGTQTTGADTIPFPTFNFNWYYNKANNGGLYYNGDQNFSNATLSPGNGVIYVNGKANFSSTCNVTGGIIATRAITISGTFNQTQVANIPALMSRDADIKIGGTSNTQGLIYTGAGKVEVTTDGTLSGQMIAYGNTSFSGGAVLSVNIVTQYPPAPSGATSPIHKITYHE